MTPDTTDTHGSADPPAGSTSRDDYRRTVLTLRVVKLALGIVVSALTVLRLLSVV
jgi:hypothetical protein